MLSERTIAAIATAPGKGGIGVIRVSGDEAFEICAKVFEAADRSNIRNAQGYTAKYGHVRLDGEIIDEAVALFFRAPRSYTAEDVVELQCHGGNAVTSLVLRAVLEAGARPAQPGEFTRRAFENGRISLTRAEAVMDMINAGGEAAVREAAAQASGREMRVIEQVKSLLVESAAELSVWADFPEDDVPAIDERKLSELLDDVCGRLSAIAKSSELGIMAREGIRTVIAGRPNVGKSSLMNMLAGFDRCIVTDIPGTTRDVVEEQIVLGEVTLALSDTAGLRDSDDSVEAIGIAEARRRIESAQLVLAVFDASEPLNDEDIELLEGLSGRNAVGIINKTDKDKKIDEQTVRSYLPLTVMISAREKSGVQELVQAVRQAAGLAEINAEYAVLANERQLDAARRALTAAQEAKTALLGGMTLDAVTVSVEEAVSALLELTGERVSEKVVDEVFSRFCVGK